MLAGPDLDERRDRVEREGQDLEAGHGLDKGDIADITPPQVEILDLPDVITLCPRLDHRGG